MDLPCIVICRDDRSGPRKPGPYRLATRTVFVNRAAAKVYASTISKSRKPLIIEGDWAGLRFGEPRGTLQQGT